MKVITDGLDKMLAANANVNLYMFHGGTSFGFGSGANSPPFQPQPTSYDYDAPISEAGDLTAKYFAIKETIQKYMPIPEIAVNATDEKGDYGLVTLGPASTLLLDSMPKTFKVTSKWPLTFETLGQAHGLVIYETTVNDFLTDPALLEIKGVHDRAYVFVDGVKMGVLTRMFGEINSMPLSIMPGQQLQVIVENQGRICFGTGINEHKGLTTNVTMNQKILEEWTMTGYPLKVYY